MTDQLIFVHDKRRDAYVDKTSEIVGLRPAGAYVYVDYGAARVFRYRKEHVVCYPLLATRRQVRIYKDGTLQEPYDTLFDYGKYVRLGAGEGLRSPAIEKSRIEAVDAQPLPADKERLLSYFAEVLAAKASLESETDTEAAEEVPEGEKKSSIAALLAETMQRIDPQDPRTALYAYLNGRTAACDVDNVALVYPFGCNASQKLAVQRALGNRVSVVEGPPGTGKTQTILNIVANLLMQGKTVGVVSNNNAAVDNVRDKLSKYEYGALMAELGNRTRRQAFFADKQQDFMPDPTWRLPAEERTALRTRLGELSAAIDELFRVNAELADLRTKRSYAQCEYRHLLWEQPLDEARMRRVDRCFFRPIDSRRALSFRHLVTERWQGGRPSLALRAGLLFRCGAWPGKRLFADAELLPAYADRKFYETYIAELSARIARLGAPSDEQRAKSLIEAYGKVSEALFRDMLYRKYERLNEARQEERPPFTMQNYRTHFRTFVERYPVVLSTTHSLCASIGAGAPARLCHHRRVVAGRYPHGGRLLRLLPEYHHHRRQPAAAAYRGGAAQGEGRGAARQTSGARRLRLRAAEHPLLLQTGLRGTAARHAAARTLPLPSAHHRLLQPEILPERAAHHDRTEGRLSLYGPDDNRLENLLP